MAFEGFGSSSSIIPHPCLHEPKLHFSGVPGHVSDAELADLFQDCLRARFHYNRGESAHAPITGLVEFEHLRNAEKAYATLQGITFGPSTPQGGLTLNTVPIQDSLDPRPSPSSTPRIIKQLPSDFSPADVFELFRIFGPIYRITLPQPGRQSNFALIEYYEEEYAENATAEMNFTEIQGLSILVEKFDSRKPAGWANSNAPAFVPKGAQSAGLSPSAAPWSPAHQTPHKAVGGQSIHAPGSIQLAQPAAQVNYDPCNLFIKNLDPTLTSQDLFLNFKGFGKIVSARVMRNEAGESKSFGFVSFEREEEAARALTATNGLRVRDRHIVVRFHEPKKYREARMRPLPGTGGSSPDRDLVNGLAGTRIDDSGSSSPAMASSAELVSPTALHTGLASVYAPDSSSYAPLTSTTATGSTRDRLLAAVRRFHPDLPDSKVDEITDLLAGLPKKDKAALLFNEEALRRKSDEARELLDSDDEEEDEAEQQKTAREPETPKVPATAGALVGAATTTSSAEAVKDAPAAAAAATTTTTTNGTAAAPTTLAELIKLPAVEIVENLKKSRPDGVAAPDPSAVNEMDEFVNSIEARPIHDRKQKLGDKLFKAVKASGVKQAPKITIHLLDNEDLRALGHLMLYPEVLSAKVATVQLKK